jgi:hypothetical protein
MNTNEILSAIDAEISKLQQARSILGSYSEPLSIKRGPGRPKKTAVLAKIVAKRTMSAEGKARIAAAQKKRWAAAKKAAK